MKDNQKTELFDDVYRGKKVLVTGHTGFKGSWLSAWLSGLGAEVTGYSIDVPTEPSNFKVMNLSSKLRHIEGDVRNLEHLKKVFDDFTPDIVFHLAAQAITRRSYDIPQETFHSNLIGTVNILECLRKSPSVKAAVLITSDKCYQNVEWMWGYRENDRLGGDDPYSASKACAEVASQAYMRSFFSKKDAPRVATARAGNVIGGGDWAVNRIVPDCYKAFSGNGTLKIRSPKATRPWQHVLEPLSGYLWLGANLLRGADGVAGESFNFGPAGNADRSVENLIKKFTEVWGGGQWITDKAEGTSKKEATLLKLNCDKAMNRLGWHSVLSFEETVRMTADWYKTYYEGGPDMYEYAFEQIKEYTDSARRQGLIWATSHALEG